MTFGMPYLLETATVEDACRLCRELGLSFVELNANFPACQAEGLRAEELLRLKAGYDIDFTFHVEEECDPFAFSFYCVSLPSRLCRHSTFVCVFIDDGIVVAVTKVFGVVYDSCYSRFIPYI